MSTNPFVDSTRNIATWAVHKGLANSGDAYNTKSDAAYAYFAAGPAATNLNTRIMDLVNWVKAGWQVTASSLKNAGHDGVTIGAMGWVASAQPSIGGRFTNYGTQPVMGGDVFRSQ